MRAEDLPKADLWMNGPEFLNKDPGDWPEQFHIRKTEEAAVEERTVEDICKGIILTQEGKKEWKVIEYIRIRKHKLSRQIGILKKVFDFLTKYLGNSRFERTRGEVEEIYIRHDQEGQFRNLLQELQGNRVGRTFAEPCPFFDEIGLIRVGSGLHPKAAFNLDTKRPLLLHTKMPVAQARMQEAHYKALGHQNGIEGILAEIQKRFWIIGARKVAKNIIKECMMCAKKKWTELQVGLPPLHPSRSATLIAFMEIGVDHAGPFRLKQGRSTVEAHVLVIACCTTRAVSLEMSLSWEQGMCWQRYNDILGSLETRDT